MTKACSIDGCTGKHVARGLCGLHYQRWKKHGDPLADPRRPVEERFWEKVDKSGECWKWTSTKNELGYGTFWLDGRTVKAHRVAWEMTFGSVSDGLDLDHLCRNRSCVNPAHLEPVTHRENVLRGTSPIARMAVTTHCPHGHPYDEANTYAHPVTGGRTCRRCGAERARAVARTETKGGE